jgi:tetratricopeptide (TPR) repeat protein
MDYLSQFHAGSGDNVGRDKVVYNFYSKSSDYKTMLDRIEELKGDLATIENKQSERGLIKSKALNKAEQELKQFKADVIQTANTIINSIGTDSERLKTARIHFENGELQEAIAILKANEMLSEQHELLEAKKFKHLELESIDKKLSQNASEFLLKAQLTAIDYTLPDRFEKTKEYFEHSLKAERNKENLLAYAFFLFEHNQFQDARTIFGETLDVYRTLAGENPPNFSEKVAHIFTYLAIIQKELHQWESSIAFSNDALFIYQNLEIDDTSKNLLNKANCLNNIGNVHLERKNFIEAQISYIKALDIHLQLPSQFQSIHTGHAYNNLGNAYEAMDMIDEAMPLYDKALGIYYQFPEDVHLPFIANIFQNQALLFRRNKQYVEAQPLFQKALTIRKDLFQKNPFSCFPEYASTLGGYGDYYFDTKQYALSLSLAKDCLSIYDSFLSKGHDSYKLKILGLKFRILVIHNLLGNQEEILKTDSSIMKILSNPNLMNSLPPELKNMGNHLIAGTFNEKMLLELNSFIAKVPKEFIKSLSDLIEPFILSKK